MFSVFHIHLTFILKGHFPVDIETSQQKAHEQSIRKLLKDKINLRQGLESFKACGNTVNVLIICNIDITYCHCKLCRSVSMKELNKDGQKDKRRENMSGK